MSELTEDDRRIIRHLRSLINNGEVYVRSRQIADAVDLTANQVGARLSRLADKVDDFEIEKWGRSRSTTWRVRAD